MNSIHIFDILQNKIKELLQTNTSKELILKSLCSIYDEIDKELKFTDFTDNLVKEILLPVLIDLALAMNTSKANNKEEVL